METPYPQSDRDNLGRRIDPVPMPEALKDTIATCYGLLWQVETDDKKIHRARRGLLSWLTKDEQARGIAMARGLLLVTEDDGSGDPLPLGWHPPSDMVCLKARILAAPNVTAEAIERIIQEKILDAWNEICSDTGCHPSDIEQLGKRRLGFHTDHWSRFASELAAHAILALISGEKA